MLLLLAQQTTGLSTACAPAFPTAFRRVLPHGSCVAVRVPNRLDDLLGLDELHPAELAHAETLRAPRQLSFVGGRLAMRRALREAGSSADAHPVMPGSTGAPALPPGIVGSISHTDGLAAALLARRSECGGEACAVGIDVELASRVPNRRISDRVLAPEEREHWRALSLGLPAPAELLLRFSLKEALYKALHPLVRSPIRWHAVRVRPRRGGGCDVELGALEEEAGARIAAHAAWSREDEHFVTTARALLLPTETDAPL